MRLLEKSYTQSLYDILSESSYYTKDSKDFEQGILLDFDLFLQDKYNANTQEELDKVHSNVSEEDIDEYFTGLFYDIADNDDLDSANAAEDLLRTTYHLSDTADNKELEENLEQVNESEDLESNEDLEKILNDEVESTGKMPDEISYKGKIYKRFDIVSKDTSGETSKSYFCNMDKTPSNDFQESNDYFFVVYTLNKVDNGYEGISNINYIEDLTESGKVLGKVLKEESYNDAFFQEIEDALVSYGFDVTRFSDAGILTSNLGWRVSNSEGEVYLTCDGTRLSETAQDNSKDKLNESKELIDNLDALADLFIDFDSEGFESRYEGDYDDKRDMLIRDIVSDKETVEAYLQDIVLEKLGTEEQQKEAQRLLDLIFHNNIIDKSNLSESKSPKKDKQPKQNKRIVMQQGNVTCLEENGSYLVFENESDNEVKYNSNEEAMQDFLSRVGIDASAELKEK